MWRDRSGAVVSERFDYTKSPVWLAEFIWRFSHLSDEERGWDVTASLVTRRGSRNSSETRSRPSWTR